MEVLPPRSFVLDIGCGPGRDSATLGEAGHAVVAFDLNVTGLLRARTAAPSAALLRGDVRAPLPFRDLAFDGAVASLSLHFFDWATTERAFQEIHRVLKPGAPLLFRVNAHDDLNFGAGTGEQVEPGFFRVAGSAAGDTVQPLKRFFTGEMVRAAVSNGWKVALLRHETTDRYDQPKQTWKCLVRRL